MPESDLRFIHLPAEIHELTAAQRREIEQAEVEILDDAAVGLNALDECDQFGLQLLRLSILHRRTLRATRVGDHQLGRLRLEQFDRHVAPFIDQLLEERPQDRQQCRGLFEAKHFHAMVLPYPWPPILSASAGQPPATGK